MSNQSVKDDIKKQLIGMIHIPIDSIIASPSSWHNELQLPFASESDWLIIRDMEVFKRVEDIALHSESSLYLDKNDDIEKLCCKLSFYEYLEARAFLEATTLFESGFDGIIVENISAPYFCRNEVPAVIPLIMYNISRKLRCTYPDWKIGIQVLAYADHFAMQIASKNNLDYVRSESALFNGLRPEGESRNHGNLAKLYLQRSMSTPFSPLVLVDFQKKHTLFPSELADIDIWISNIIFQKIEAVVLTGEHTGQSVDIKQLKYVHKVISDLNIASSLKPLICTGSGIDTYNMREISDYSDILIVGSSIKVNGFWENELDPVRVKKLGALWNKYIN